MQLSLWSALILCLLLFFCGILIGYKSGKRSMLARIKDAWYQGGNLSEVFHEEESSLNEPEIGV